MRTLAIIPARKGSKGVPGKNVRDVAGQPLVSYSIQTALETPVLDAIVVTTDDDAVRSIAESLGVQVITRPTQLAGDAIGMAPVLQHALLEAERGLEPFDVVVLLQPTAPIRRPDDIHNVLQLLVAHPETESIVSVIRVEDTHPGRMYRLDEASRLDPLWPEWERVNRQDLPPVYLRNGAIYAVRRATLLQGDVIGGRAIAYPMPAKWLANIDDERDLIVTSALLTALREGRLG